MRAGALFALVIHTVSHASCFAAQRANQHNVGNRYRQRLIDYPARWCSFLTFYVFFNNMDALNDNFVGGGKYSKDGAGFTAIIALYDSYRIVSSNFHLIKLPVLMK